MDNIVIANASTANNSSGGGIKNKSRQLAPNTLLVSQELGAPYKPSVGLLESSAQNNLAPNTSANNNNTNNSNNSNNNSDNNNTNNRYNTRERGNKLATPQKRNTYLKAKSRLS